MFTNVAMQHEKELIKEPYQKQGKRKFVPAVRSHRGRRYITSAQNVAHRTRNIANDVTKPLQPAFRHSTQAINSNADYVFPISCISGALLINYAGSANNDPMVAAGGAAAALSNSFLFASKLAGSKLKSALNRVKGAVQIGDRLAARINAPKVSMAGLTAAGACYIGAGLNAPDIAAQFGDPQAIKDAIRNINLPETTMGIAVSGAALSKLCGANDLSSKLGMMLPGTLGYYAVNDFAQSGNVNAPILGAMFLYAVGAYAIKSVGASAPSPNPATSDPQP